MTRTCPKCGIELRWNPADHIVACRGKKNSFVPVLNKSEKRRYMEEIEVLQRKARELSRLTSGLRELAESWRKNSEFAGPDYGLALRDCAYELQTKLALIPEATKEVTE
jgi:hypothetical protein